MNLEEMRKKYESGKYIAIWRTKLIHLGSDCKSYWLIAPCDIKFTNDFNDYKLISKRHKDILDAYLDDTNVKIEFMVNDTCTIWHTITRDFIESYNEEYEYQLGRKLDWKFEDKMVAKVPRKITKEELLKFVKEHSYPNSKEEKGKTLIRNSIITPDGTELVSRHNHDYKEHLDKNGEVYTNNGGTDYMIRLFPIEPYTDNSVFLEDSFERIRSECDWGTYGKGRTKDLHYKKIKDMSNAHLEAIVSDLGENTYYGIISKELEYRKQNDIFIED